MTFSPAIPFVNVPPEIMGYGEIAKINSQILIDEMIKSYQQCRKNNILCGLGTDAGSTLVTHYNFVNELILFSINFNSGKI